MNEVQLKKVLIVTDALDEESYEKHIVPSLSELLQDRFKEWPSTARIYHKTVSEETDITPATEEQADNIDSFEGPFIVVVYPADGATAIFVLKALLVSVALSAVMSMFVKEPAIPTQRNIKNESPNNGLSERTNRARVNSRIPDIYGTVRSVPDLLASPYKVFNNHEEVEYSYMCVGRGYYDIPENEVKDDTTRVKDIPGISVEVYAPNTSPNNSSTPQLRIGNAINTPVYNTTRLNSVNGQTLRAPNNQYMNGAGDIRFVYPNLIELSSTSPLDFTSKFSAGDSVVIENASVYDNLTTEVRTIYAWNTGYFVFPSSTIPSQYQVGGKVTLIGAAIPVFGAGTADISGVYEISGVSVVTLDIGFGEQDYCKITLVDPESYNPRWNDVGLGSGGISVSLSVATNAELYNLNGTYNIVSVGVDTIALSSPSTVNPAWSSITTTPYVSPRLSVTGPRWVGPFIVNTSTCTKLFTNFVALNGLYKDNGQAQFRTDVECELEVTQIDANDNAIGSPSTYSATVIGSESVRGVRAYTLQVTLPFTGRCKVRARRITEYDAGFSGQVVDEIKWRDLYAVTPVSDLHFGEVTTVQSVTYATAGSLAVKERKLNMLVTRKIPKRISGSTFSTELYATSSADEIIAYICKDPKIGNRSNSEIDFDNIYSTIAEVNAYFGTTKATQFNYTFDNTNLSFEETLRLISEAIFCIPYRRGNVLKLSFEKETDISTLLFNHRNKLPNTETRTVRFGNSENYDGIVYKYIDPKDDAQVSYYIPSDMSALNPKEFESAGVRDKLQAHLHAWRLWNKIKYQNTVVEFTGTHECDLLITNDKILVSDNTRTGTQDGEVLAQDVLTLTLSQDVILESAVNYSIFLQLYDGTVDNIPVVSQVQSNKVQIQRPPLLALSLDDDNYARTTYMLVGDTDERVNAFLVTEKDPQSNFTSVVKAVNYSSKYYSNDLDYKNGVVDINANYI